MKVRLSKVLRLGYEWSCLVRLGSVWLDYVLLVYYGLFLYIRLG